MDSKRCAGCKKTKPVSEFGTKQKGKKTYVRSRCKPCWAKYIRNYRKDPEKMKAHKDRVAARYRELSEFVAGLKSGPCVDCERTFNSWQMHFDHLPEFDKDKAISDMVRDGQSKDQILTEVEKCELVCACCHADRTYRRRNSSGG